MRDAQNLGAIDTSSSIGIETPVRVSVWLKFTKFLKWELTLHL